MLNWEKIEKSVLLDKVMCDFSFEVPLSILQPQGSCPLSILADQYSSFHCETRPRMAQCRRKLNCCCKWCVICRQFASTNRRDMQTRVRLKPLLLYDIFNCTHDLSRQTKYVYVLFWSRLKIWFHNEYQFCQLTFKSECFCAQK